MKRLLALVFLGMFIVLPLAGCGAGSVSDDASAPSGEANGFASLEDAADAAVGLLQKKDYTGLSGLVHPEKGVRFSPYAFIDPEKDVVLTAEDVAGLGENKQVYDWGSYDGSGEKISLDFGQYYSKFIFDQDFAHAEKVGAENEVIGMGNTTNNLEEVYPDNSFIEYHFSGFDPAYEGMDWVSLRLVFEKIDENWYLVGIVHDQWTT